MKNRASQFKLFRGIGLKEWGYDDEAYDLVTEIIRDEIEDTLPDLTSRACSVPNARKVTKNGKRKLETPAKVEPVAADQGRSRTPRPEWQRNPPQQQRNWYDERRSWHETD